MITTKNNPAVKMNPTKAQINYAIWISKEHFGKQCIFTGKALLGLCALNGSHIMPRRPYIELAANPHNIVPISAIEDEAFERISPRKRIAYMFDRVSEFNPRVLNKLTDWINLLREEARTFRIAVEY